MGLTYFCANVVLFFAFMLPLVMAWVKNNTGHSYLNVNTSQTVHSQKILVLNEYEYNATIRPIIIYLKRTFDIILKNNSDRNNDIHVHSHNINTRMFLIFLWYEYTRIRKYVILYNSLSYIPFIMCAYLLNMPHLKMHFIQNNRCID